MKKTHKIILSFLSLLSVSAHANTSNSDAHQKNKLPNTIQNIDENEIVTLTSPIIDHCFLVEDSVLKQMEATKGGWAPVSYKGAKDIIKWLPGTPKILPGGSGVNVMKGLAKLGHSCSVLGKIGNDKNGEEFTKHLEEQRIKARFHSYSFETGISICLITHDRERTFRTYDGSVHQKDRLDLKRKYFKGAKLFHLEGYQVLDKNLTLQALKLAKKEGLVISLDLANINLVKFEKDFITHLLTNYVDIVFSNEAEASELSNLPAKEACNYISNLCKGVSVVTLGKDGCYIQKDGVQVYAPAVDVPVYDCTGAGDYFAAGFLHQFLNNRPLIECAKLGNLIASFVIQNLGAEISHKQWDVIAKSQTDTMPDFSTSSIQG